MSHVRRWGWKPEPPRASDFKASALLAAAPEPPPAASLRVRAGTRFDVLDQQRNDCVAHAVARGVQVALTPAGAEPAPLPSRDWGYYLSGVPAGDQTRDDGRFIRDCIAAYSRAGWPDEVGWPYGSWPNHPGGEAFRLAYDRRSRDGIAYHRITDMQGAERRRELSQAIASGYPVVFGTMVTQPFEEQDGINPLPLPGQSDGILGGHAIAMLEYDEAGIGFMNSWGPAWADVGWGRLSWDWMTSGYVSDCWAIQIVPGIAAQGAA